MAESFGADSEGLSDKAINLVKYSNDAAQIHRELTTTLNAYTGPAMGKGGEIHESLVANYLPGALAGVKFLENVRALLEANGQQTHDLSQVVEGADGDTTAITNGRRH